MTQPVAEFVDTSSRTREILCHRLGAVMSRAACRVRLKRAKKMIHNPHFRDCRECGGKNIAAVEEVKTLGTIGTCEVCGKENMALPSRVKGKKVCGFCRNNLPPALELGVPFDVAEEEIKLKRHLAAPGNKIQWSWNERPEDKVDSECKRASCNHYNSFALSGCDLFPFEELSLCKIRRKAAPEVAPAEKVLGECSEPKVNQDKPESEPKASTNTFAKPKETQASTEKASDKIGDIPGFKSVTVKSDAGLPSEVVIMRLDERRVKILKWIYDRGEEQMRDCESQLWWMLERMMDEDRETA